jgi:hypothetical protein
MIGTGTGYQSNALAGFARASQQEQTRETANRQADATAEQQNLQLGAQAASIGVMAYLGYALLAA